MSQWTHTDKLSEMTLIFHYLYTPLCLPVTSLGFTIPCLDPFVSSFIQIFIGICFKNLKASCFGHVLDCCCLVKVPTYI